VDAEERAFQRLYGPWAPQTPSGAAELLGGLTAPWWISGGWAIEAFSGVERRHEDVDVTIFRADVGRLRHHLSGTHDLWAAGSGTLRPLTDERPRAPRWAGQVWIREHARAPWVLDVQLNAGRRDRWVFKRDPSVVRRLDEATWVAADGIRYLRPELVLAHKARHARVKDDADLEATLPLLDQASRAWLTAFVSDTVPGHRWLERLG
jgi:hypothetical protein